MNKLRFTVKSVAAVTFMLAFVSIAQAQATRTWVSGVGDDVNPCSRTAPCKTFAGAISKTAINGEIDCIDPGSFGAVTITKSLIIDGGGTFAGILAGSSTGIIVNLTIDPALDPVSTVRLRNLSLNGAGSCGAGCGTRTGIRGINVSTANTRAVNLIVENLYIDGFVNEGILFNPPNGGNLTVKNSTIVNNAGDGISVSASAGTAKASLDNVNSTNNGTGVHAKQTSRVIANNCNFSHNTGDGVFSDATAGATTIRLWSSFISLNGGNGIHAGNLGGGTSGVEIGMNEINNNTGAGVLVGTGGTVETFTNNSIRGNVGGNTCPCTAVGPGL